MARFFSNMARFFSNYAQEITLVGAFACGTYTGNWLLAKSIASVLMAGCEFTRGVRLPPAEHLFSVVSTAGATWMVVDFAQMIVTAFMYLGGATVPSVYVFQKLGAFVFGVLLAFGYKNVNPFDAAEAYQAGHRGMMELSVKGGMISYMAVDMVIYMGGYKPG